MPGVKPVLKMGMEHDMLTLVQEEGGQGRFRLHRQDLISLCPDEPDSTWLECWEDVLAALNPYTWATHYPLYVAPEFAGRMLAIVKPLEENTHLFYRWLLICEGKQSIMEMLIREGEALILVQESEGQGRFQFCELYYAYWMSLPTALQAPEH